MIASLAIAAVAAMHLQSADVAAGGSFAPAQMASDCGGANRSPALAWSGAPAGTRSFAVVLIDPDAPVAGGFVHWVLYDLPANATHVPGGAPIANTGLASTGKAAYYGPCPPPGPAHHYVLTLYALDLRHAGVSAPPTAAALQRAIAGHVLATATLRATASSP